jgi:hypothetical protein
MDLSLAFSSMNILLVYKASLTFYVCKMLAQNFVLLCSNLLPCCCPLYIHSQLLPRQLFVSVPVTDRPPSLLLLAPALIYTLVHNCRSVGAILAVAVPAVLLQLSSCGGCLSCRRRRRRLSCRRWCWWCRLGRFFGSIG